MAGKVSNLFECPKCKTPMSSEQEKPEKCPNPVCRFRFRSNDQPVTTKFHWPRGLGEQLFEMKQVLAEELLDKPLHEINPNLTKEEAEQISLSKAQKLEMIERKLLTEKDDFLMTTQVEDVQDLIKSIHYLMTIAIPSGNRELVTFLAVHGEQIGNMAKVLKEYLERGGRFYDPKTQPRDS